MIFSYNKFLRPITTSDNNIQVLDNTGSVVYTINPFSVGTTRVSNNVLEISFKSGKIIHIPFSSINESKIALGLFQSQIDTLLTKTPTLIDIQIKNYIDSVVGDNNELSEILTNGRNVDSIGDINDVNSNNSINLNFRTLYNSNGSEILSWSASSNQGLVYSDDYSTGFSTHSLVDKIYVDSGTNSIWSYIYDNEKTFGNGLQTNGSTVSLGGTVSSNLTLNGSGYDMIFTEFDNIVFTSSVYDVVSDFISLDSNDSIQILALTDLVIDAGGQLSISASSSLISINDGKGITYQSDYSSGFVNRSLVDKEYVDNSILIGSSGTSGTSGSSGSSGTSGTSGSSGSSGTSGTSGSSGTSGTSGSSGSSGTSGLNGISGGSIYYLNTSLVDGIYSELGVIGTGLSQSFCTASVGPSSTSIFKSYVTSIDRPGVTRIPPGIWSFTLHMSRSGAGGVLSAFAEVYILNDMDEETLLFSTDPTTITSILGYPNATMIITDGYYNGLDSLNISDRLLVKINASNSSTGTYTLYLLSEGNQHYSFVQTTLGTVSSSGSSGTSGLSGSSGTSGLSGTSGVTPIGPQNYSQVLGARVTGVSSTGSTIITGSITTNGGPVSITVTGDGNAIGGSAYSRLQIHRNGTPVGNIVQVENAVNNNVPYCLTFIDSQSAGTYTYSVKTVSGIGGTMDFGEVSGPTLTMIELTGSGLNGSSGTSGSSGSSGTSGITPTTDWTLSGNLTVSGTASFNGLTLLQEVSEVINTTPGATSSTVVYDFSTGSNWYHSSATTNYTSNFTNVPTNNNRAITVTIVIVQGATAYVPTAVQINGSSTTIKWSGSNTGNANQTDIIGFTFMRISSSWVVLGQINTFA